jgi:hypothetical protein
MHASYVLDDGLWVIFKKKRISKKKSRIIKKKCEDFTSVDNFADVKSDAFTSVKMSRKM